MTFYFQISPLLKDVFIQQVENDLAFKIMQAKERLLPSLQSEILRVISLDEVVDGLSDELGIRITVIDFDGTVLADSALDGDELAHMTDHSHRPELLDAIGHSYGARIRYSDTLGKEMMYVALRADTAFIRGAYPMSIIEKKISSVNNGVLVALVFALFASGVVGFILSGSVSRSLKKMLEVTQKISSGDMNQRIHYSTSDEMGSLGKAINQMADNLERQFKKLNYEKSQLRIILDSMVEGIVVTDSSGLIVTYNPAFMKIMSFEGNGIGKTVMECCRKQELDECVKQALAEKKSQQRAVSIKNPGGHMGEYILHSAPLIDSTDGVKGTVSVFYDITEIKRLENVRREFVANVSHELKTPLTSIRGYTETLLGGALEDSEVSRRFLEKIQKNAARLQSLVEDVLELSKIESGRLNLKLESIDMLSFVRSIFNDFAERAAQKSIRLSYEISDSLPQLQADSSALNHILTNLVDNALKYTPEKGEIKVKVSNDVKYMHVAVIDNGIGIPKEDLGRIYERFYRVDKARSKEEGGTGLGLAIVKHMVQAHGGHVTASSTKDKGSTFTFSLPLIHASS